jgi:hypothetical protein
VNRRPQIVQEILPGPEINFRRDVTNCSTVSGWSIHDHVGPIRVLNANSNRGHPDMKVIALCDRFQQRRGAGSGLASDDRDRSAARYGRESRLSPSVRNHQ